MLRRSLFTRNTGNRIIIIASSRTFISSLKCWQSCGGQSGKLFELCIAYICAPSNRPVSPIVLSPACLLPLVRRRVRICSMAVNTFAYIRQRISSTTYYVIWMCSACSKTHQMSAEVSSCVEHRFLLLLPLLNWWWQPCKTLKCQLWTIILAHFCGKFLNFSDTFCSIPFKLLLINMRNMSSRKKFKRYTGKPFSLLVRFLIDARIWEYFFCVTAHFPNLHPFSIMRNNH